MMWILIGLILCAVIVVWTMLASAGRADRDADAILRSRQGGSIFLAGPAQSRDYLRTARSLRDHRYIVFVTDDADGPPTAMSMRNDLDALMRADSVAVMPLWNYWPRPRLLVAVAVALGVPVVRADNLAPLPLAQRKLIVREVSGECDCPQEAVIERVGELYGQAAKRVLISQN